jgi:hypothetical protein
MAPERTAHARAKGHIFRRLADAVEKEASGCEAFIDGLSVVINDNTVYEPLAAKRAFGRIYAAWALSQDFYRANLHLSWSGKPDIA